MSRERRGLRVGGLFAAGGAGFSPQRQLSGPVPWVVAIMVALSVLALAAVLALGNAGMTASASLSAGVSVQIVEPRRDAREAQTRAAIAALRANGAVAWVRRVPQAEADALVEPWLGEDFDKVGGGAISVPALIEAELRGDASADVVQRLRTALAPVAPAARIDANAQWLAPVFDALRALGALAAAAIALLGAALVSAVLLAVRAAFMANRETIEIVQLLGATDRQVAQVFQRGIGIDAAAGGAIGLALAVPAIALLAARFEALGPGLLEGGTLGWSDWITLALVPLASAVLAILTARITVLRSLRKLL
jgi:cell division transport system permease protein